MVDSVTLHADVSVPDASEAETERYEQMAQLLEDNFLTFIDKDRQYGSAYSTLAEIHETYEMNVFDSPLDASLFGLFTRLSDKQQRFATLAFSDTKRYDEESLRDTALDAANYWLLVALQLTDENAYEDVDWPFSSKSTGSEKIRLSEVTDD